MSLEAWEDGFRRDRTPEREIAHWLHLGRVYSRLTASETGTERLPRRQAIFRVLAGCGISPPDKALTVTNYNPLSRDEAENVIAAFFGGSASLPEQ